MVKEKKELYHKPEDLEKRISNWIEPGFSEAGINILTDRYLMKDESGKVIETTKEMLYRVAHVIGKADSNYAGSNPEETEKEFYELMASKKFLPNSPTLKGAGLNINLSACYVVPIEDSREGIFKEALFNAVEIQAHGGGTGFNFSQLRGKGSLIRSTGGKASGPVSFMGIIDKTVGDTIAQGGTRQGANMGILRYDHPDIDLFVDCKAEDGAIKNFNISVGITEEFMEMVNEGKDFPLIDHKGKEVGRKNAKELFDKIVHNAWKRGDPGLIYLDRIDKDNPTPHVGKITATNPCGEQPLLDLEACNIGSINLGVFVKDKKIDWNDLEKTVYSGIHFLDNVIDANEYPLKKTEKEVRELREILEKQIGDKKTIDDIVEKYSESPITKAVLGNRKVGLGVMGFSDMLISLGIGYGSEESYQLAEQVMEFISEKSREASVKLAETRGVFPNWKGSIYDSESKYFKGKELKLRNACTNTLAPTGTISTALGASGGIEPQFGLVYFRKSIYDEAGKAKLESFIVDAGFERIAKEEGFFTNELLEEIGKNKGSLEGVKRPANVSLKRWRELKELFTVANDLPYVEHIRMQDAFQKHVDNAISKTINLPNNATEEDVRGAYLMTFETSVKGITVYRDGSRKNQVLSSEKIKKLEGKRPLTIGPVIEQKTPFGNAFIALMFLREDTTVPYESFVNIGKGGKDIGAIAEGYGRLVSLVFKLGGKVEDVIEQLQGISGESIAGLGPNKVTSLPDAYAQGLAEAWRQMNNENGDSKNGRNENFSGNICPTCGSKMMMVEGCQKCTNPNCGYSKC
ncbi:Vitamin B12-dependent ribonucleoside-diphosphate reductase [uncultured archaeon]|nr:Vitamin B12-dependent ribonucleoside-diphosphate reductase [uncultured archaeon]